ncbi:MAG: ABC transporter substrate-binding protein [Treponema sp.]|jgi:iron complex transport system substrate-binding protein|nr:ABC transporter substrate-binding protein [Treponema sp.]
MNKRQCLLFFVLILFFFLSCANRGTSAGPPQDSSKNPPGNSTENPPAALYWKKTAGPEGGRITDKMGNSVPLARYRRIIAISPGAVETLYLIGAEDSILAISQGRDLIWPEEKTPLLPTIGNQARPNAEMIVSMEPDLIIGNTMNVSLIEDFRNRGYRALIHGAYHMEDIFNNTLLMGILTGREAAAEILVAAKRAELDAIKADLAEHPLGLKGAFLYAANPVMAFTGATLAGDALRILGVENIAERLNIAEPILSPENILAENPDFLFGSISFRTPGDLLAADPVIAQTRAGREKFIRIIPTALFLRSSPRMVEKLLELYDEIKDYSKQ